MEINCTTRSKKIKQFIKSRLFFFSFLILGSLLLLLIIFALVNMAIKHMVLNFDNFLAVLMDQYVIYTIFLTFYASFVSTIITIVFGTPLAYILGRYEFKGKSIINSLLNVPLMIPHSVAGLLIFALFFRYGILGSTFSQIGISFEDNINGIVVALLFVSMPIYINTTRDGFKSINPHLFNVASSLGANERKIFMRIMLPLNKRSIITGSMMCWARGISEFGAVILIAYYPMIAPVLIYYRFNTLGLAGSAPIALLLIVICVIIFWIINRLTKGKKQEFR